MALAYDTPVRNAMLDTITARLDLGANALLRIYDGTRPATGGAATTLLAALTLSDPAASAASGGVLAFSSITSSSVITGGTATWFRLVTSAGTFVVDGSVGTSGSDLNLNTLALVANAQISVTSFVITEGNP
jgi:hypothetical protein